MNAGHRRALVIDLLLLTAGTYLAAAIVVTARTPWPTVIVLALAAGAAAMFSALLITREAWWAIAATAWAVVLSGWMCWVRFTGQVFGQTPALALIVPVLLLIPFTLAVYAGWLRARARAEADAAARRARARLAAWDRVFAACGIDGVRALRIADTNAGEDVTIALPGNGRYTLRSMQNYTDNLAAATKLPASSIAFEIGRHAGELVMHVDRKDSLGDDLPYPPDVRRKTVKEPLTLGRYPDGRRIEVLLRLYATLVTGATGSGKSNLLNVLIAELTQCEDCVVWICDLKGGPLAAPWIRPWVEGRCPHPAIDWVATNRDEAELMLRAIDAVIEQRNASLLGSSKIDPSPRQPQIVVIGDEIFDVIGDVHRHEQTAGATNNTIFAELVSRITRKQRSAACPPVWTTQRGVGMTAIKANCRIRLSLGTVSEAESRAITDNNAVARMLAAAGHAGSVIVEHPRLHAAMMGKAYRLDADDDGELIDALAAHAGHTRPIPEQAAIDLMGTAYADRWDRSPLYQALYADWQQRTGPAVPAQPQAPAQAPAPGGGVAVAELPADVDAEAQRLLADAGLTAGQPEPRDRMYAILAGYRNFGLSVGEICTRLTKEGLGRDRTTVHRWLREDLDATPPRVRKTGEGNGARYFLTELSPPPG